MEFLEASAYLKPYVHCFTVYAEHGTGFARRREVPSGLATLVLNLGPELRVEHPVETRTAFAAGKGFYTGLSSTYAVTETNGDQEGVQVMLTPLGARCLLGMPLVEVGDELVDPIDLFGSAARETVERLQNTSTSSHRLAILEQWMERQFAESRPPPCNLVFALKRLQASSGRTGIGALAAELGCSRKHLTVCFRREFGLPPKLFARVLRFDHAMRLLKHDRIATWAGLADECGYADQAHLSREFRAFAGSPPAAFLRRQLPDEGGFTD